MSEQSGRMLLGWKAGFDKPHCLCLGSWEGKMDMLVSSSAYIWERRGFPYSLTDSLILSLPLSLFCFFPHAASQTALITAPFEAVFQNENEEKAEVIESSRLNFLQLLLKCISL